MRVPKTLLRVLIAGLTIVAILVPAYAASADPTPSQVTDQIDKASHELEDVIEEYNGISEDLKATQTAAAELQVRIKALQEQLDAAYRDVTVVAAAAYRGSGQLRTLSVLLSAGSSEGVTHQLATLRFVNRSHQQDIDQYVKTKKTLDEENKRYQDLITQKSVKQRQLAERKATIEGNIRDLEALKIRLNAQVVTRPSTVDTPTPAQPPAAAPAAPPAGSGAAGAAVSFAYAQLGKPYIWGASGPNSYDCSGLTKAAWARAGVALPHNAAQQWNRISHVSRNSLQPGDLVFYRGLGHVGIYVSAGKVIHAPTTGDVVKVASVDMMPPYGYGRPG